MPPFIAQTRWSNANVGWRAGRCPQQALRSSLPNVAQRTRIKLSSLTRASTRTAGSDQTTHTLRRRRLDIRLPAKAGSCRMREPRRIVRIGVVCLHPLRLWRLPSVDAHKRYTQFANAVADRWQHATRLDNGANDLNISLDLIGYRSWAASILSGASFRPFSSTMKTCALSIGRSNPA